jgi:hypothetical protein
VSITINGVDYGTTTFTTPVDGIALSPDAKTLYYCAVQVRGARSSTATGLLTWACRA